MSLFSLPTELIQQIPSSIPSYVHGDVFDRSSESSIKGPIIELDPTLRGLCATNRRSIFFPSLYDTIGTDSVVRFIVSYRENSEIPYILRHITFCQRTQRQEWDGVPTDGALGGFSAPNVNANRHTSPFTRNLLARLPSLLSFTSQTDEFYIDQRLMTVINVNLRILFGNGPANSISVDRLVLSARDTSFLGDLIVPTFRKLRTLEFKAVPTDSAWKPDAFIARHPSLTNIILSNCEANEPEGFPGEEARHILGEEGEGGRDGMTMCTKKVKVFIEDRTEDVVSCILENLPTCAEIWLNFDMDDGRDQSINKILWSILLSCSKYTPPPLPKNPSSLHPLRRQRSWQDPSLSRSRHDPSLI
ncbi:uncharacterized protein STEHIDRAFT_136692 [Stereum hirsutum FP-91666 SS1]|uniref:uncharacterized protein n=1 Tax=Stereum hirsutum (strain FP-91666) TaxID=721885 RepID=UPI000440E807|nr:uncharacterized protein STEHIDRAFT_136692 [Stereum hirsutum FP-91666 SS1]EIM90634.1 hypothetical protein STEHIDRAFT_136692 [Stereum hirsutum FP-91666 SS1]